MIFSRWRVIPVLLIFLLLGSRVLCAGTRYIEFTRGTVHLHLTVGKIHKLVFPEEIVDIFVPSASKVSVVHNEDYVYIKPLVPFEGVFLLEGVGRNTYELSVKVDHKKSYTIFKILNEAINKASARQTASPRPANPGRPGESPKISLIKVMIRGENPRGYEVQDVAGLSLNHPALLKGLSSRDLAYRLERIYTSPSLKGLVISIENLSHRRQFIDISRIEYPGCVIRAVLDKYLYPRGSQTPADDTRLLERPWKTQLYIVVQENML
jgi:hypothetical protein